MAPSLRGRGRGRIASWRSVLHAAGVGSTGGRSMRGTARGTSRRWRGCGSMTCARAWGICERRASGHGRRGGGSWRGRSIARCDRRRRRCGARSCAQKGVIVGERAAQGERLRGGGVGCRVGGVVGVSGLGGARAGAVGWRVARPVGPGRAVWFGFRPGRVVWLSRPDAAVVFGARESARRFADAFGGWAERVR